MSDRYSFVTQLTDDFDSILRETESILVLVTSVDDLTVQIDDSVTIEVIDGKERVEDN